MSNQLLEIAGATEAQEIAAPFSIKKILFATDFSQASFAALPYIEAVAGYYGSEVHVVHVVGSGDFTLLPKQEQERMFGEAQRKMQDFLGRASGFTSLRQLLRGESVLRPRYTQILKCGEPSEIIRQLGQSLDVDLVVLGTNGRRGLKRFVLGSVAEEIFRLVPWPVLTVGPRARKVTEAVQFRRILFATDFAPASLAALPYALRMARQHQATLTILSVAQSKDEREETEMRLKDLIPEELASQSKFELLVPVGSRVPAILRTAKARKADLIILGVRCGGMWDRAATHAPGPVAYNVIAQAPCPVLTIRSHQTSCDQAGGTSE